MLKVSMTSTSLLKIRKLTHVEDDRPNQALRLERMRTEIERDKLTNLPNNDMFDEMPSNLEPNVK